ncbi:ABC transporter permease [Bermanella sp. R86510]|uniref:ABC transporter permease n=1 Tax=unclassified Bermanella TaxID=2627862 RepID=UPI0037C7E033
MKAVPKVYWVSALITLLALTPILVLLWLSASAPVFFDQYTLGILGNTLALVSVTVVASVLVGVPLAILTAYINIPWRGFWLIAFSTPLAIPSYVGAFTYYASFGASGELSQLLGFSLPKMEGLWGAAWVMTLYTFPFVMLTTRASLRSLDANLVNAARTLGLSLSQAIWRIVLPRAYNGIAAGALLVALYCLSDFATPAMMRYDTFTRAIFVEYNAFGLSQAALLSVHLMVIVSAVLYLESRVKATQEKPGQGLQIWLCPVWTYFVLFLSVLFILAAMLPLFILTLWLIRDGAGGFDPMIVWNSASSSLLAAVIVIFLAVPLAYAAMKGKFGRIMERISYIGFGVPGIVMGTALIYVGLQLPFLYQTLALLVLAYVLRFLPLAVGAIRSNAERLDPSLVNAARTLGARPQEAYRRITFPLTVRGMIAGAALVFLEAMRELPATLLLGPTGFETLATYLWRVYEAGYFGRAALPGLLLVVISSIGLVFMLSGERRVDSGLTGDGK